MQYEVKSKYDRLMHLCYSAYSERPAYSELLSEALHLIGSGEIDVTCQEEDYTFLMAASHCGCIPLMEALIDARADPRGAISEAKRGMRTDAIAYLNAKFSPKPV